MNDSVHKVLVVDDEESNRMIISMYMETKLLSDVSEAKNSSEAIEKIGTDCEQVKIIFCDYDMPGGNGNELYQYIQSHKKDTIFVLTTARSLKGLEGFEDFDSENSKRFYIQKPFNMKEFLATLDVIIGQDESLNKPKQTTSHFLKLKVKYLQYIKKLPVDIRIKLGPDKYIKVYEKDAVLEQREVEKFCAKFNSFYVEQADFKTLYLQFIDNLLDDKNLGDEKESVRIERQSSTLELVYKVFEHFNIDEETIKLIDKVHNSVLKEAMSTKSLKGVLKNIDFENQDYETQHSVVIGYISNAMLSFSKWNTPRNMEKLCLASLLHDLGITSKKDIERHDLKGIIDFTIREQQTLKQHPSNICDKLEHVSSVDTEVINIIKAHHELPNGKGYPRGVSGKHLPTLAKIFIVAQSYVHFLFKYDFKEVSYQKYLESEGENIDHSSVSEELTLLKQVTY